MSGNYEGDNERATDGAQEEQSAWRNTLTPQETYTVEPDTLYSVKVDKPSNSDVQEICSMLKVRTSMLAMGACERIKKLARAWPTDVIASPILNELVQVLLDGPGMPLANAAMGAMATMALRPEGRQRIVLLGGAVPLIRLISRCDFQRPNTDRAVQLLMNLAADTHNRRTIREAGGVEALVALMRASPLDAHMEHAMGALHNVMLTDSKAKTRAVDCGVAYPLARVLATRLDESHTLAVRCRMLISDLLRIPDMQQRLIAAAMEQGIRIPGIMANMSIPHRTSQGSSRSASSTAVPAPANGGQEGSPSPVKGEEEEGVIEGVEGMDGEGQQGAEEATPST